MLYNEHDKLYFVSECKTSFDNLREKGDLEKERGREREREREGEEREERRRTLSDLGTFLE